MRDFGSVREFFTSSTIATLADIPFIAVFLLLVASIAGNLVWVIMLGGILMLLPAYILQRRMLALTRQTQGASAKAGRLLQEVLSELDTLKTQRGEERAIRLWDEFNALSSYSSAEQRRLAAMLTYWSQGVQQATYIAAVVVGTYLVFAGQFTIGTIIAVGILTSRTLAPLTQFAGILARWPNVKAALEALDMVAEAAQEKEEGRSYLRREALKGHFELHEMEYRYAADGAQNARGMTAGGNILVGDSYRPEWGSGDAVDGTPSGTSNFTIEQVGIFNRREWLKTRPELPGESERIVTGTSERTREIRRYVTWQEPYAYYAWQDSGEFRTINVTERVQTGTREEAVYEWRTLPALIPPPYGRPRRVRVQTGTRTVPVYENVVIGTRQEPIRERVFQEFRTRTRGAWRSYDPPRFENYTVTHRAWVRPMHPNPGYEGPAYVPRYYSFGEGDPVPIMNGEGHFDPSSQLWIADERAPAVADALLGLAGDRDARDRTRAFGLRSFAPISAELYAEERRVFERRGFLSARCG